MEGQTVTRTDFSVCVQKRKKSKFEEMGAQFRTCLEQARMDPNDKRIMPHQIDAVLRTYNLLKSDEIERRPAIPALIVTPTGSGKSAMIAMLLYLLQAHKAAIITPSHEISKQIAATLGLYNDKKSFFEKAELLKEKNDLDKFLERPQLIQKSSEVFQAASNLCIVNAQKFGGKSGASLINKVNAKDEEVVSDINEFFRQFDLLLIDEAHHYPAETWKRIVNAFSTYSREGQFKKIVFLTATPYRNQNNEFIIGEKFGGEKRIAFMATRAELEGNFWKK